MKQVKTANDVPSGEHIAVLVYKTHSVYHEGDERSRTNPGHGYPAYTEEINAFEHYVFVGDEWLVGDELSSFLKTLEFPQYGGHKDPYVVLKVAKKLVATPTVSVKLT